MNEKKSDSFGIIAFIINIPVFLINLFCFFQCWYNNYENEWKAISNGIAKVIDTDVFLYKR